MGFVTRRWLQCIAVLALAALASCTFEEPSLTQKLQSALDARVRRCDVKGASAAVVLPDGTTWRGASGVSHENVKMSPDMAFAIGSITKNLVAALALQLAEEGKLSLEDPVAKWLPPYEHVNPAITIRQMLNHTSGLFMFWENQQLWDDLIRCRNKTFTPEEVLSYLKAPYFDPGQGYRYSNTGYLLSAMIIRRATGSKLSAEFRRRFWEPLGLESACMPPEDPYPENPAHVWGDNFEKGGAFRDITFLPRVSHDTITYGSGGVFMTAEDLARWAHALFRGMVLRAGSLHQMQTFGRGDYGLGLSRLGYRAAGGLKAVGHSGGNIGTTAWMLYLPDHEVSIAVMVNRLDGNCGSIIARDIARTTALHRNPQAVFSAFWLEGLMAIVWLFFALGATIYAVRRDKPLILVAFGGLAIAAGWVWDTRGFPLNYVLYPAGAAIAALGLAMYLRRILRSAPHPV